MTMNRKAAEAAAQTADGRTFARTRAALANSARSYGTRQRIMRELSLLSDRALADLGLFRSDIETFARDASRIAGAEALPKAFAADLRALIGAARVAANTAG
ncbi:MAG TPA: DUF1127 domain-containing protein [Candidatus Cybelea sp.]|nr:DUF1127 domain-containing protein [Candidatus Cybelea sp.]